MDAVVLQLETKAAVEQMSTRLAWPMYCLQRWNSHRPCSHATIFAPPPAGCIDAARPRVDAMGCASWKLEGGLGDGVVCVGKTGDVVLWEVAQWKETRVGDHPIIDPILRAYYGAQ